jgi:hypothetical protein
MDYSALPDDAENAVESSPWSSSPRLSRSAFPARSSSDFQSSADTLGGGYGATSTSGDQYAPTLDGRTLHEAQEHEEQPESEGTPQSPALDGRSSRQAPPAPALHSHPSYSTPRPAAAPRANVPQYRLQAKITGLERTGRKDLILRFDVHVRGFTFMFQQ